MSILGKYLEYKPTDRKEKLAFDFQDIGELKSEVGYDACTDGTGGLSCTIGPTGPVEITFSRDIPSGEGEEDKMQARKETPLYPWVSIINSGSLKKQDVEVKEDGVTIFTMRRAFPVRAEINENEQETLGEDLTFLAEGFDA